MISRIKLQNWKTHENTELKFSEGVNALVGVMGSGKSSIVDAICFALFGTFPALQQRRIKLDNVIMRYPSKKSNSFVELELNREGKVYTIIRKIELNKGTVFSEIKEDGVVLESPNTQRVTDIVEKILKIDHDLFSQIIYAEQNRLDFLLQIPRGQRMKRVDELLKINKFEKARENTTTLINKLKQKKIVKSEDALRLEEQLKGIDKDKIKKEIQEIQEQQKNIENDVELLEKESKNLKKVVDELKSKQDEYEGLNNKKVSLKGKIEQLNQELKEFDLDKIKEYELEFVEKQVGILSKALLAQNQFERKYIELEQQNKSLRGQTDSIQNKISELKGKRVMFKGMEELEKKLEDKEKEKNNISGEIINFENKLKEEERLLKDLEKAKSKCPTCDSPLTENKQKNLLKKKNTNLNNLKGKFEKGKNKEIRINKELDILREEHRNLLKYAEVEENIREYKKEQNELLSNLNKITKEIGEIKEKYSEDKKEKIEGEIKRFDRIKDALRHVLHKEEFEKNIRAIEEKLASIGFKTEDLEQNQSKLNDILRKIDVQKEKKNSLGALFKEKKERQDNIEKQAGLLEEYKKESKKLEWVDQELNKFRLILEQTQASLREQFIGSINQTMSSIWETLYPYEDYIDIRLFIDGDYILQLQSIDGSWINVEGTVSGGERTTAVLTLRLALALILAPNIKWLVLDEPTHNLDRKTVEELAETFRTKINDLIEQVFIISHDENLESAVTGKLYKLERGENKKEATKIIEN
jgi:exonuclease SbcC